MNRLLMKNFVHTWAKAVKGHLQTSPLHAAWRFIKQRSQINAVADFLSANPTSIYSVELLQKLLNERARHRLKIPHQPGIAAFGTNDWEDKGMWQAWSTISKFSLFNYGDFIKTYRSKQPSSLLLPEFLANAFLDHIKEIQKKESIHLAFFYAAGEFLPNFLFEKLHDQGIWTVLLGLDDKQQLVGPSAGKAPTPQLNAAQQTDLYWGTWRGSLDRLVSLGVRPFYAPCGADPTIFRPLSLKRDIDVLWLGRGYGPRYDLVRFLRKKLKPGISVVAHGPGWPGGSVPFEKMLTLYSRSKIILGMGGVGQTDAFKHLKARDFEVPMAGGLYLTSFNPELADYYDIGREILCYSSPIECLDVITWILERDTIAESIRKRARLKSEQQHTWEKRIGSILQLLSS